MPLITPGQIALLGEARRAVLATIRPDGTPRLVPIAFAADVAHEGGLTIYSALDEKPKSVADPRRLGRVRDILARPQVSLLVDRWSEDWSGIAWLRLDGRAALLEPDAPDPAEHGRAMSMLRARYAQYADQRLERRPVIRIEVERLTGWSAA